MEQKRTVSNQFVDFARYLGQFALALVFFSACSPQKDSGKKSSSAASAADGYSLYAQNCASCHGATPIFRTTYQPIATVNPYQSFGPSTNPYQSTNPIYNSYASTYPSSYPTTNSSTQKSFFGVETTDIAAAIQNQPMMANLKGKLTDAQVGSISLYLKQVKNSGMVSPNVSNYPNASSNIYPSSTGFSPNGELLFTQKCSGSSCHGSAMNPSNGAARSTAQEISSAISRVNQMRNLQVDSSELNAISAFLMTK